MTQLEKRITIKIREWKRGKKEKRGKDRREYDKRRRDKEKWERKRKMSWINEGIRKRTRKSKE